MTSVRLPVTARLRRWLFENTRYYCHRCDHISWVWQKCRHRPRWWRG